MTPEQFVYWLQGFAEVHGVAPSEAEWTIIKDHLALVFRKETPKRVVEKSELERWLEQNPPKPSAPNWGIAPPVGYPLKVTC